jgi:hypothetical protein
LAAEDQLAAEHHNPRIATAPIAAAGLIAGYAVAVGTGSRPLGGVVLAGFGLACLATWLRRDGRRTAVLLTVAGLLAFALSHVLAQVVGAWPAVLIMGAAIAALCWQVSDRRSPAVDAGVTRSAGRPARS